VPRRDSIDKVVEGYFAAVTSRPFVWKGETIEPPPTLRVPTTILRGFTCPSGCGGCCSTFTLDYLPEPIELHPYPLTARTVELDGRDVIVWSDTQDDNRGPRCRNLDPGDGRCGIHGRQPFSCDFELLGVQRGQQSWTLTTRLFSRGWNMHRTDGGVGSLCELIPATPEWRDDVSRRLRRLDTWARHFGLTTCLPHVLDWIDAVGDDVIAGREVSDLRLRASRR
jgi:hypothetical protein